ncbi:MAG: hypothetical protein BGN88_04970 [Clostridiales bacterium 43-6]|nr:MAG: hypothetical protein BGN88_04970 [Clostridiales bacterium 43-6]
MLYPNHLSQLRIKKFNPKENNDLGNSGYGVTQTKFYEVMDNEPAVQIVNPVQTVKPVLGPPTRLQYLGEQLAQYQDKYQKAEQEAEKIKSNLEGILKKKNEEKAKLDAFAAKAMKNLESNPMKVSGGKPGTNVNVIEHKKRYIPPTWNRTEEQKDGDRQWVQKIAEKGNANAKIEKLSAEYMLEYDRVNPFGKDSMKDDRIAPSDWKLAKDMVGKVMNQEPLRPSEKAWIKKFSKLYNSFTINTAIKPTEKDETGISNLDKYVIDEYLFSTISNPYKAGVIHGANSMTMGLPGLLNKDFKKALDVTSTYQPTGSMIGGLTGDAALYTATGGLVGALGRSLSTTSKIAQTAPMVYKIIKNPVVNRLLADQVATLITQTPGIVMKGQQAGKSADEIFGDVLKSQAISGATGLAFEGVFKAGGYLWRELRGVKRGEIVPAEKIQEAIAKDLDRGIATSVENGSGRIKNTDGLAAGADAGLAKAYLGADSALTDAGQGMVKGSQPTYREMAARYGNGTDTLAGKLANTAGVRAIQQRLYVPVSNVTRRVASKIKRNIPQLNAKQNNPFQKPIANLGGKGYNTKSGSSLLDDAFLHSNDFMFREREAVLPSVWKQMGMKERTQMLKDSLTAQKLNMSLKDYKEANKILEEVRKNYADELPKRMQDSLEKQAPVQYIDDVVPDYMLDFIDKPNFGLPDAIQNADTGIYGDMRQQVLEETGAGVTGHGYAKGRGVPLMLSDEAAAYLDAVNFHMFAADAGSKIKFSEMTPDEAMKIAHEYRAKAPIEIPENATVKPASKTGYEQISYKWKDSNYKYEVRWHTRTPGAPKNQGNTWVVERVTPGSGGVDPKSHILVEGQWISKFQWQAAIKAYQNGTATQQQLEILEKGHWKE